MFAPPAAIGDSLDQTPVVGIALFGNNSAPARTIGLRPSGKGVPTMNRARLLLMVVILVGVTSCANLIVNSNHVGLQDRRCDDKCCPVHGDALIESVVRMDLQSRISRTFAYTDIKAALFPASFESTNDTRHAPVRVKYCPHCRLALELYEDSWEDDEMRRLHESDVELFVARQRAELQSHHPETRFVDSVEIAEPTESQAALETDTPEWVK
jgi:hypothetical protein